MGGVSTQYHFATFYSVASDHCVGFACCSGFEKKAGNLSWWVSKTGLPRSINVVSCFLSLPGELVWVDWCEDGELSASFPGLSSPSLVKVASVVTLPRALTL